MEFSRRSAPHLPQPPQERRLGRDLIIAHPTGREFPKGEGAHALSLWTLLCTPPLMTKVTRREAKQTKPRRWRGFNK